MTHSVEMGSKILKLNKKYEWDEWTDGSNISHMERKLYFLNSVVLINSSHLI